MACFRLNSILKYNHGLWNSVTLSKMMSIQSKPEVHVNLFRELGVSGKIRKCLSAEGITIPTIIQHEVLPMTLTHTQHCIIQSPTGSGKTLTFLIPALQDFSLGLHSLILVPSRELAIQIEHVAIKLISKGKLSRSVLTLYSGGSDSVVLKDVVRASPPNIIIGTPKRILELVTLEGSMFKSLRRIILDEVDKLLPSQKKSQHIKLPFKVKSHHEHVKPTSLIMKKIMHNNVQCIASSATIDEELVDKLLRCGWSEDYRLISTSQIESLTTPKEIKHGYILDSGDMNLIEYNKLDILTSYLRKNPGKAMIVIHRNAPISAFVFELRERKVNAVPLHEHTLNAETYSSFLQQFQTGMYLNCIVYCTSNMHVFNGSP